MSEEKEPKWLDLRECVRPAFDRIMDDFVRSVPKERLFTPQAGYTVKKILQDHLICGGLEINAAAFDEGDGWVKYLLVYNVPFVTEYYHEAGMCCILEVRDGDWRVLFCTLHRKPGEPDEYRYMKDMDKPSDLYAAFDEWKYGHFGKAKRKEEMERRAKYAVEHPDDREPPKEQKKTGLLAKLFGKK